MASEIVAKIHADVSQVLDMQQTKDFVRTNSFERVNVSPHEVGEMVNAGVVHWSKLINELGIKGH